MRRNTGKATTRFISNIIWAVLIYPDSTNKYSKYKFSISSRVKVSRKNLSLISKNSLGHGIISEESNPGPDAPSSVYLAQWRNPDKG